MANIKEVYQFECEVFSPETTQKSEDELMKMIYKLYSYFPKQVNGDSDTFKPYDPTNPYSILWFKCYEHLIMLLEEKKNQKKYDLSLKISYAAILISIAGILVRFFI